MQRLGCHTWAADVKGAIRHPCNRATPTGGAVAPRTRGGVYDVVRAVEMHIDKKLQVCIVH